MGNLEVLVITLAFVFIVVHFVCKKQDRKDLESEELIRFLYPYYRLHCLKEALDELEKEDVKND